MKVLSPGAVQPSFVQALPVSETIIPTNATTTTITNAPTTQPSKISNLRIVLNVMGVVFWVFGSILNIVGDGLVFTSNSSGATSAGTLYIIGFSLWIIGSIVHPGLSTLHSLFHLEKKYLASRILYLSASVMLICSMILFVIGAALFTAAAFGFSLAAQVIWIVAASLWLLSTLAMGVDVMVAIMIGTIQLRRAVIGRAIGFALSVAAAVLFIIGAVMFNVRGNIANGNVGFQTSASVLWIVGSSAVVGSTFANAIAV
ncbi:hypothetical protein AKO1_005795 [Acrasis kona]|uniref:Uncharacterized protein n=1 Tax=Acrasis kona TaxID=1008807 RepID=A0AAW2YK37_9EUKA